MPFGFLRREPSDAWPVAGPIALEFDAAARALNGVALGAPADAVARFGRPDSSRAARRGTYEYRALGLTVTAERGRVTVFTFSFNDPVQEDYEACTLRLRLPRDELTLTAGVRARDLERTLGKPRATAVFSDDSSIEFEVAGTWLEFSVLPDGHVVALGVYIRTPEA